jgi:glycosyltransferase involved in cell wall biosynthesis
MTKGARVSVIIPTLNRAELTLRAYNSAKSQTYQNIEIIVIDNGSSPDEIDQLLQSNIDLHYEQIRGAGAARLRGVARASGEYLLFLDSDDELVGTGVEALVNNLAPESQLIYGQVLNVNDTDTRIVHQSSRTLAPLASCSLMRSKVFDLFGQMPLDNFSWPKWFMSARDKGLVYQELNELIALRHIHGGNLSIAEGSYSELFKIIRKRLEAGNAR